MNLTDEASAFQNRWLALFFFIGFVLLSNTLQWVFEAGPRGVYILQVALGVSVILSCTAATAALQSMPFSGPALIGSGWAGALIAWALCVWEIGKGNRGAWILENLGRNTGGLLFFLAYAGILLLVTKGGLKLAGRQRLSTLVVWVCFGIAFLISDGLRWMYLLIDRSAQ